MFETVAPEAFESRSRRVFYETLPLSLTIHAVGIAAAMAATIWTVVFPTDSPRVSVAYSLTRIPDPPPPPPPPKPQAAPEPAKPALPPPPAIMKLAQLLAPSVIPDKIPDVVPVPEPPPPPPPVVEKAPVSTAGNAEGELGGDIAGRLRGKVGGVVFPDDGRVHVERNQKLPMESVEQEYPRYPSEAQKKRLEDQVVVRYIIGTNGRVKDVEIIDHAKEKMFDDAAVEAIRRWRFRPLIKDGKAMEVVHELAVNFELIVR